ncbi:NfeD family protein [Alicyclobacillus tolerans]|uniref:NfeD family protein n=1 Tax=Alicyclobacillus tolerans TaxID=90970 RepID=UPI001F1F445E|nr:NfeD family protein [Alicyclobacillus tolerans]MCF8563827.1 NfeD family protein [Alicyclobacillus tolerans]
MPWWVWLFVALAVGIVELSSVTFVLLWIAVAALITTAITPFVTNVWSQFVVFAVVSIALFAATRPLAKKWRRKRKYPDRLQSMANQVGLVVTGSEPGSLATVRVHGELWSAQCEKPLLPGDKVLVKHAEAAVLTVAPIAPGEENTAESGNNANHL